MVKSRAHLANAVLLLALLTGHLEVVGLLSVAGSGFGRAMLVTAVGLSAMNYGVAWILPRFPDSVNMPNQKKYDALSGDGKRAVIAVWQRFFYWFTTAWLGAFAGATAMDLFVASAAQVEWVLFVIVLVVVGIVDLVLAIRALIKTTRIVRERYEAEHGSSE